MGKESGVYRVLVGKHKDLRIDGKIILRWMFRKWDVGSTGSSWLRIGTGVGNL
jgi:hypothetical protein